METGGVVLASKEEAEQMYIVHLWLRDIVKSISGLWKEDEEIMLKHADDKGDQLFRGEDGGLKCVMDWDW